MTVDLDPAFAISKRLITEDNLQVIVIENVEDPSAGNATIMLIPLLVSEEVNPQDFSSLFENVVVGGLKLEGFKEVGNFTVTDNYGRDVQVHTFNQPKPLTPSGRTEFASWYLDERNYISMVSSLDNITKQVIETLTIVP